jgi:hypothetical protein
MWRAVLVPFLALAAGCGGEKFAPVSGRVTLNGKPLIGATVSFQPVAPDGSANAAPGSVGKTGANGEYILTGSDGRAGAWVGKHRVMITLVTEVAEADARPPRGGWPQKEKVPAKYNSASKETYEVPAGGTTGADFALTDP